jgi:hypothetical protein
MFFDHILSVAFFYMCAQIVTPPEAHEWYSESLIILPGTYQVSP